MGGSCGVLILSKKVLFLMEKDGMKVAGFLTFVPEIFDNIFLLAFFFLPIMSVCVTLVVRARGCTYPGFNTGGYCICDPCLIS